MRRQQSKKKTTSALSSQIFSDSPPKTMSLDDLFNRSKPDDVPQTNLKKMVKRKESNNKSKSLNKLKSSPLNAELEKAAALFKMESNEDVLLNMGTILNMMLKLDSFANENLELFELMELPDDFDNEEIELTHQLRVEFFKRLFDSNNVRAAALDALNGTDSSSTSNASVQNYSDGGSWIRLVLIILIIIMAIATIALGVKFINNKRKDEALAGERGQNLV
jgi:acyl-CoA-binding protein